MWGLRWPLNIIFEEWELNANRHLARSVTCKAVICEVLLYLLNLYHTGGSSCFTLGLSKDKNKEDLLIPGGIRLRPIKLDIMFKEPLKTYPEVLSARPQKSQLVNLYKYWNTIEMIWLFYILHGSARGQGGALFSPLKLIW